MKINSLYLKGYKRLGLSGIHVIHIELQKKILCLLGSNGSGKSSIIYQLSPLPGLPIDFYKGGCKILMCEKGSDIYSLESHFDEDRPRFLFYKNGENLNAGKTITIFKELVKTEFGISEDVHEVLIGTTPFNEMQVNQRRQWFTKMPGVNYDYAIGYYKRLKERQKEVTVLLKNANENLVRERAKLLSDEQIADMSDAVEQMKNAVDKLLSSKSNDLPDIDSIRNYKAQLVSRSDKLMSEYTKIQTVLGAHTRDIDYATVIDDLKSQSVQLDTKVQFILSQMEIVEQKLSKLEVPDKEEVVKAPESIASHTNSINTLKSQLRIINSDMSKDDIVVAISRLSTWTDTLAGICTTLSFPLVCESDLLPIKIKRQTLETNIQKLKYEYREVSTDLKHLLTHKESTDTQCPACSHTWKIGYSAVLEKTVTNRKENIHLSIQKLEQELLETDKLVESVSTNVHASDSIRQYNATVCSLIKDVAPINYWDEPMSIIGFHSSLMDELSIVKQINSYQSKIADLEHLLKINDEQDRKLKDSLVSEMEVLSSQYHDAKELKMYVVTKLEDTKSLLSTSNRLNELRREIVSIIHDTTNYKRVVKRHMLSALINKAIHNLKIEISTLEHRVLTAKLHANTVEQIEKSIVELSNSADGLKQAVDVLSPTDGLIAEGLQRFLSTFIQDMNTFIDRVWTYPLEIKCDTPKGEDLDVDFKFEVIPEGSSGVPDASKTSKGQKEIIDLAFRITSMKYRGLKDYPIYLDEFGVHMDHTHKHKAIRAITDMVTQDDQTQVFLVSHFASAYASLSDAQFVILHKDNIIVPDSIDYTTGVSIEYKSIENSPSTRDNNETRNA